MSRERTVPTEQQRAIKAVLSGVLLGLALALMARPRGSERPPTR